MLMHNISQSIKDGKMIYEHAEWYVYSSNGATNVGSSPVQDHINIEPDCDFMVHKITSRLVNEVGGGAGTPFTIPIAEVLILLTSIVDGRIMFDMPIQLSAIAGWGGLEYIPPIPFRLLANSTVRLTWQETGNINVNDYLYLYLDGCKVWE